MAKASHGDPAIDEEAKELLKTISSFHAYRKRDNLSEDILRNLLLACGMLFVKCIPHLIVRVKQSPNINNG
jgi:hypothetical protein